MFSPKEVELAGGRHRHAAAYSGGGLGQAAAGSDRGLHGWLYALAERTSWRARGSLHHPPQCDGCRSRLDGCDLPAMRRSLAVSRVSPSRVSRGLENRCQPHWGLSRLSNIGTPMNKYLDNSYRVSGLSFRRAIKVFVFVCVVGCYRAAEMPQRPGENSAAKVVGTEPSLMRCNRSICPRLSQSGHVD